MKNRIVSSINVISPINISSYEEMSLSILKQFSLMCNYVASQHSIWVYIVCVIVTPVDMVGWDQHIIEILKTLHMDRFRLGTQIA
jgi:hypothetical protein